MDTETLIKKLAATTAPRSVMAGVCDALIERDELRAENIALHVKNDNLEMSIKKPVKQLRCNVCGAFVSTTVPINTVVRGWIECPECIERKPDVDNLRAENERPTAALRENKRGIDGAKG